MPRIDRDHIWTADQSGLYSIDSVNDYVEDIGGVREVYIKKSFQTTFKKYTF